MPKKRSGFGMSKPIMCTACGDIVGVYNYPLFYRLSYSGPCPGKGNHKRKRVEKKRLFNRVEVWNFYEETQTQSHYFEWRGKSKTILALALLFTPGHSLFETSTKKWIN